MKLTVAIIGIIAIFFASIPRSKFKYGLEIAWIILCGFLAIRYDFGNDYIGYLENFNYINSGSVFRIDKDLHEEPGWQILCYLFKPFGFYAMVVVLTIFECFVIYRLIKEYVPERYYWFSIFLFVFNPDMMLVGASMMRQMLAIILVVCSVKYIKNHKIIPFALLIFLASQFHSSATILYPLYLLGYIKNIRANKKVYALIIVAYIALSLVSAQLTPVIEEVATLTGEEETVEIYTENAKFNERNTGIGIILQIFLFVYIVLTLHKYNYSTRLIFLMLTIGTFVSPFASVIPLIERFSYYFDIFALACYPIIWGGDKEWNRLGDRTKAIFSKKRLWDLCAISIIILLTIYEYTQFFDNIVWIEKFSTYHTIFEL